MNTDKSVPDSSEKRYGATVVNSFAARKGVAAFRKTQHSIFPEKLQFNIDYAAKNF